MSSGLARPHGLDGPRPAPPFLFGASDGRNEAIVEEEAKRLQYQEGWAFMMAPEAWFRCAEAILVGLNPGLDKGEPEGCWDCVETEGYNAPHNPLYRQVNGIRTALGFNERQLVGAQFVPFRSRNWAGLARRDEAITFSISLWTWLLCACPARLLICMGSDAAGQIAQLVGAVAVDEHIPAGWGRTRFQRFVAPDGRVVVSIPHPSRYKLMTRSNAELVEFSAAALRRATRPVPAQPA